MNLRLKWQLLGIREALKNSLVFICLDISEQYYVEVRVHRPSLYRPHTPLQLVASYDRFVGYGDSDLYFNNNLIRIPTVLVRKIKLYGGTKILTANRLFQIHSSKSPPDGIISHITVMFLNLL